MEIGDIKRLLRKNGYKLTSQRRVVLEVMSKFSGLHMSADELYSEIKKIMPDVGIATVYRTLMLFNRLGIVSKLLLDDNIARYELKIENEEGHHHLICKSCSKIQEVHEFMLDDLVMYIRNEYKFEILTHNLLFEGYCENCKNN